MTDHLAGEELMKTVQALADDIGPRPAGHAEEEQARQYLREQLAAAKIQDVETVSFRTIDTWGYLTIIPAVTAVLGSLVARMKGLFCWIGKLLTIVGFLELWRGYTVHPQWLASFYPKNPGGSVIARIQPTGEVKQKVVLIGHVDSNKHRPSFSPEMKRFLRPMATLSFFLAGINVVSQFMGDGKLAKRLRLVSRLGLAGGTAFLLNDEREGFVDGANDNASAVACVLGLGKHVNENPLEQTEVWLAFTGSEEVGHDGLKAILDKHGDTLKGAWFIDFEMIGAGSVHYVTKHSGFMHFSAYHPDPYSAQLAARVARELPELGVTGRELVIEEEVDTLRKNGFRGICIAGVGDDGFLANWHQYSDNSSNVHPEPMEQAARFVWAMLEDIDRIGKVET